MGMLALLLLLFPALTLAHTDAGVTGGFLSGFTHPILGWDHVVAMVAVGLWGAFLGAPAIWLLPIVFPLVMAFGATLGVLGVPIPAIETGIAGSAVVLGLLILLAARLPLWLAGMIVGVFAIFHGYAHGAEMPSVANAITYSLGFMIGTAALHVAGVVLGDISQHYRAGKFLLRLAGAGIAAMGAYFLAGAGA